MRRRDGDRLSVGCGGDGRFGRPFLDTYAGCLYGSRAQHLDGNIGRRGEPHGVEGERDARRAAQRREFGSGQDPVHVPRGVGRIRETDVTREFETVGDSPARQSAIGQIGRRCLAFRGDLGAESGI